MVDKYINRHERLNDLCLAKFVTNYDTKLSKKCTKRITICCLSFNQHKDQKNHYRELLISFRPFIISKFNLQGTHDSWKTSYIKQKNNMEKNPKTICV